ncbi:MAG: sensor histidine kinase [Nitrospira sp.]|nr:sensor histidine kinase [bacterium]MBL7047917.1 sensor histidine kinase [Nitrospira sp.]
MIDLSLHILDIAENSVTAGANLIKITIIKDSLSNVLSIEINDNGRGMSRELLENAKDPFYTTRLTRKVGLGLPLLSQAAEEAQGVFDIKSGPEGTCVFVSFQLDHIDRKPLGDMAATISILIASNPGASFLYTHKINENIYTLDTEEIKSELEEIPINTPDVIIAIKNDINDWLNIND